MALSFGRGKQGEAKPGETNNEAPASAPKAAPQAAANSAPVEGLDESWFETALEEESAKPKASPFAAPPVPSAYVNHAEEASGSEFDIFAELEEPPARPARPAAQSPVAASFDMADILSKDAAPVSPAFGAEGTPFDNAALNASSAAPAKAKGGLKKVLPIVALVAVLGGGGYFWISQQNSVSDETEPLPTVPAAPEPPPAPAPGPAQPPTPVKPDGAAPAPAATETPMKHAIGKLWFEGAQAKHAGNKKLALQKWREAVKLAKSKPGYEQSAKMVQEAIDKLK